MNCDQFHSGINPYLDDELEASSRVPFEAHRESCRDCDAALGKRRELRQQLRSMPVPPPEEGFLDSVAGQAIVELQRNESKFWLSAGIGGAVAASLVAWLVLTLPAGLPTPPASTDLETVTIALNTEKVFRLTFESERELQSASLTVELPAGTEIVGYEGRNPVRWSTNIQPGTNILELPVIVRSGSGGPVLAKIEHEGKDKSFRFAIEVT